MRDSSYYLLAAQMPDGWTCPRYSYQLPDFSLPDIQVVVAGPYESYDEAETDAFVYLDDGCVVYILKDGETVNGFAPHEA